ncbi:tRNA-uridine aminocarboxypropyltransferase [Pseudomonas oryzae]|uniref:tRNA-uridine aminocarboxypropyltransferase n=1 Tax=Pseudomonas oryzae TaxID=1392877 RepID=A0A1H1SWM1_9PSED|nr:DTW domain-containing protein [Pseudomonas oryzae]SDS52344.1 DTW domain-containing protein YfiP [Pseudomonas oryzae]
MSRARCPRCARPLTHCLCPLIPHLENRTRVLILQHPDETRHALNTARLAALGLANADLRVGEHFPELEMELAGREVWLLFPGEQACSVEQLAAADAGPQGERWLIVPDGTWRKARRILHCNPWLARLPRLTLEEARASRYRLRKAPGPGALSTLEAIVHCLNTLEGAGRFDALLRPFEALIDGQIAAMGEDTYRRNHLGEGRPE